MPQSSGETMTQSHYSLRWNNHQNHMLAAFEALLQAETLVDVTLVCDDFSIRAHKVVLTASSPLFQKIFADNPCDHPVIVLKDFEGELIQLLVDFMYRGEISVSQEHLQNLMKAAENLQVRGLAPPGRYDKPPDHIVNRHSTPTPSASPDLDKPYFTSTSGVSVRSQCVSPLSYEPPVKLPHMSRLSFPDTLMPRQECQSPITRRKQARPRRRSGEICIAQDLSKSATPPIDETPENLSMKKTKDERSNRLEEEKFRAATTRASELPRSPELDLSLASKEFRPSPPVSLPPLNMKHEIENHSPLSYPPMPSVSALAMTPPHSKFFGLDSPLGLFPSALENCRNPLFDLPDPRTTPDSQLYAKKKSKLPSLPTGARSESTYSHLVHDYSNTSTSMRSQVPIYRFPGQPSTSKQCKLADDDEIPGPSSGTRSQVPIYGFPGQPSTRRQSKLADDDEIAGPSASTRSQVPIYGFPGQPSTRRQSKLADDDEIAGPSSGRRSQVPIYGFSGQPSTRRPCKLADDDEIPGPSSGEYRLSIYDLPDKPSTSRPSKLPAEYPLVQQFKLPIYNFPGKPSTDPSQFRTDDGIFRPPPINPPPINFYNNLQYFGFSDKPYTITSQQNMPHLPFTPTHSQFRYYDPTGKPCTITSQQIVSLSGEVDGEPSTNKQERQLLKSESNSKQSTKKQRRRLSKSESDAKPSTRKQRRQLSKSESDCTPSTSKQSQLPQDDDNSQSSSKQSKLSTGDDGNQSTKERVGRPKGQHSAPRGGPPRSWTNAELTEALQHVWNKKMTTSQASRIFGIPYNSLLMYVRGKYGKSLKLEQLRKDCIGGPPNSSNMDLLNMPSSNNNNNSLKNDRSEQDIQPTRPSSNEPPQPPLYNPFGHGYYPDYNTFPIPVSMIHLLPQSEKIREHYVQQSQQDDDCSKSEEVKNEMEEDSDVFRPPTLSVDGRRELVQQNGQD